MGASVGGFGRWRTDSPVAAGSARGFGRYADSPVAAGVAREFNSVTEVRGAEIPMSRAGCGDENRQQRGKGRGRRAIATVMG